MWLVFPKLSHLGVTFWVCGSWELCALTLASTSSSLLLFFKTLFSFLCLKDQFSSVQLLIHVWLFATPWIAACQAGLPVHHQLPEFTQTHVHWISDAIQPSHPLLSPSSPTFNLSQHQGLFKWVSSSHRVAKVLEFQLQHQSFEWIFRTDFL